MTNEEALERLTSILDTGVTDAKVLLFTEDYEAIDYAIKVLEQQPCEDCISRKAVLGIKTIAPIALAMNGEAVQYKGVVFVRDLEKLPPVTPQSYKAESEDKE